MSMIGNYNAIASEQLAAFIKDPSLVIKYLYPEQFAPRSNLISKIIKFFRSDSQSRDGYLPGDNGRLEWIEIDKAWHGIHYTLTGEPEGGSEPLVNTVLGGTEIGEDVGYGPARYLTPDQVAAVSVALEPITPEVFKSRVDCVALAEAEIYPDIWDEGDEAVEYLAEYYEHIRLFSSKRTTLVMLF